jgi:hypothetical protein
MEIEARNDSEWFKNIFMEIEHMTYLDSASYLPMTLRKLPEAFGLSVNKSSYPHYFNMKRNLDYVAPMPGIEYFGVNEMAESERSEFLASYAQQKDDVFDNRQVLEQYCQDDVTVLREVCQYSDVISWRSGTSTFFSRRSP